MKAVMPNKKNIQLTLVLCVFLFIVDVFRAYVAPRFVFWLNPEASKFITDEFAPMMKESFAEFTPAYLEVAFYHTMSYVLLALCSSYLMACCLNMWFAKTKNKNGVGDN